MSRPGTLDSLAATGKAPPTAMRTATGAKTGMRTGTKGSMVSDMKDALTETLVKKMREKFGAQDVSTQDIIGQEVVAFMTTTGSVKEDDIAKLEGRISDRITGKAPGRRYKGPVVDEWAKITKWEAEQSAREEERLRAELKMRQKKMKEELDAQMEEHKQKLEAEKEMERRYADEEQMALEAWKKEEVTKMTRRAEQAQKLKKDRDAQLDDQARRRAEYMAAKAKEEEEAKKLLAMEHKRKMDEESKQRLKMKAEMAALLEQNKLSMQHQEELKQRDWAEDLKYQKEYAAKLEKQEADRKKALEVMKEKQKHQETRGAAVGSYKRWMDDSIIEKNFAEREAQLDQAEMDAVRKIKESNLEMRKIIAEQLKEKQERKAKDNSEEKTRVDLFNKRLTVLDRKEKEQEYEALKQKLTHKGELEAQMRDNAVRKQVFPMSSTERSLNADLLNKIGM